MQELLQQQDLKKQWKLQRSSQLVWDVYDTPSCSLEPWALEPRDTRSLLELANEQGSTFVRVPIVHVAMAERDSFPPAAGL